MKITDAIISAKKAEDDIKALTDQLSKYKALIQMYFDKNDLKEFEVVQESTSGRKLVATKTERVYVDYNIDKLRESLSKDVFDEITSKSYEIVDIETLKSLLKAAGISASEFKKCIKVTQSINKDALKQLYSVGDIKAKDIQGCYDAKIVKGISIKERTGDTD